MKITFVQSENENLAVEYLSAILKKAGHTVEMAYDHRYFARTAVSVPFLAGLLDARQMLTDRVVGGAPDLVCFSVMTSDYQWALDMARRIKEACDVPILFGGIHAISVPDMVISEDPVDMVCAGEGDNVIVSLADQIGKYPDVDVPGVWVKAEGVVRRSEIGDLLSDLDSLPFPDKDLFYDELPWLSNGYLLITSRGCPYVCTFCGNDVLRRVYKGKGRYVRKRSVENVMSEMVNACDRYHPERFNILDDCFTTDRSWLGDFCRRYSREIGLPFIAISHPQLIDDEVAGLLAGAGCFMLLLGVQSSSEAIRTEVLNRKETNRQIVEAARICHCYGLRFSIDHIFGIPHEGIEEYRHALGFYNRLRPSAVNTYWLIYFPGTRIVDTALEVGMLEPDDLDLINRGVANTSVNVGIGRSGDGEQGVAYRNYAFLFTLIPLLPERLLDILIKRGIYLDRWEVPISLTSAMRVLALIKMGILRIYAGEILGILKGFIGSALELARYRLLKRKYWGHIFYRRISGSGIRACM